MGWTSTIVDCIAWMTLGWYILMVSMSIFGSTVANLKYRQVPPPLPVLRSQKLKKQPSTSRRKRGRKKKQRTSQQNISPSFQQDDDQRSDSGRFLSPSSSSSTSSSTTPNPTPITGLSVISKPSNTLLPSVSILRPLCGLDSNLEENLESSFLLNWPNDRFELILCSEEQDPVTDLILDLVNRLIKKYPHVNARFIKS